MIQHTLAKSYTDVLLTAVFISGMYKTKGLPACLPGYFGISCIPKLSWSASATFVFVHMHATDKDCSQHNVWQYYMCITFFNCTYVEMYCHSSFPN